MPTLDELENRIEMIIKQMKENNIKTDSWIFSMDELVLIDNCIKNTKLIKSENEKPEIRFKMFTDDIYYSNKHILNAVIIELNKIYNVIDRVSSNIEIIDFNNSIDILTSLLNLLKINIIDMK